MARSSNRPLTADELAANAKDTADLDARLDALFAGRAPRSDPVARRAASGLPEADDAARGAAALARHPVLASMRLMHMGCEDGVHHYKHPISRASFTIDEATGALSGEYADTREPTDDAHEIARSLET